MMKKTVLSLLFLACSLASSAGVGFWNTLFGDGGQEFVCYSRIHRSYYLAIFIAVVVLAIIAYSRYRIKKRSAEELGRQKDVIAEQNKDILDSIRYASRMQEALKPDREKIAGVLPETFFWLQPRDIVGGDFYYVEIIGKKVVVAAIDCTGHGVPGAFLTFIGHNALKHALQKCGTADLSAVMDEMNREVKSTLGQERKGNELSDGMEVAICLLDTDSKTLQYCGAGSPLLIWTSDELKDIRATKCTVGSIQEHITAPPPAQTFQLNKGDAFYLGSDGVTDQFGGPEGKKFRREQLRQLITSCATEKMDTQQKIISEKIMNWKGRMQQTDDMLLIGVRV